MMTEGKDILEDFFSKTVPQPGDAERHERLDKMKKEEDDKKERERKEKEDRHKACHWMINDENTLKERKGNLGKELEYYCLTGDNPFKDCTLETDPLCIVYPDGTEINFGVMDGWAITAAFGGKPTREIFKREISSDPDRKNGKKSYRGWRNYATYLLVCDIENSHELYEKREKHGRWKSGKEFKEWLVGICESTDSRDIQDIGRRFLGCNIEKKDRYGGWGSGSEFEEWLVEVSGDAGSENVMYKGCEPSDDIENFDKSSIDFDEIADVYNRMREEDEKAERDDYLDDLDN